MGNRKSGIRRVGTLAVLLLAAAHADAADARRAAATLYWDATWAQFQIVDALPLRAAGLVSVTRTLSVDIAAPRETVYDVYSNLYNALGRHSFLREIVAIRCTANRFDFIAVEDIPLGPAVLPLRTVSRQVFHRPESYSADTYDRPMTITHQTIRFAALSPTLTRVTEELNFESSPLLINTAVSGGIEAHTAVQQSLKTAIEAGELTPPVPYPAFLPIPCPGSAQAVAD